MKATEQYFSVVLFIMLCTAVLTSGKRQTKIGPLKRITYSLTYDKKWCYLHDVGNYSYTPVIKEDQTTV